MGERDFVKAVRAAIETLLEDDSETGLFMREQNLTDAIAMIRQQLRLMSK